mmetsp:Transcript_7273/g.10132  ORF Transcript_7273/g.10132 Transcript_7273/m.10132 type:complete len:122 (-) Transcript_7273:375-740(-)|eukprot:CAMPEP_0197294842 /NCGR_PEP_ID=MMETSP0890-20130614/33738_1 /TAXON_ID=44058 ORGANISM="Aureoumbra lagunensis, Strain CCMP1510" /NCGR_SAMPLE_ID=MMETSP0890 /ASSEMBLY_ACC=CAM_ASM_000533 /LENGTH=121 /DNA_ID=CAMNT_0042770489 /DNA_START=147 /DNA_END=512 /DNA_ORIENTATION=+
MNKGEKGRKEEHFLDNYKSSSSSSESIIIEVPASVGIAASEEDGVIVALDTICCKLGGITSCDGSIKPSSASLLVDEVADFDVILLAEVDLLAAGFRKVLGFILVFFSDSSEPDSEAAAAR